MAMFASLGYFFFPGILSVTSICTKHKSWFRPTPCELIFQYNTNAHNTYANPTSKSTPEGLSIGRSGDYRNHH
jgi:hypothetical protein